MKSVSKEELKSTLGAYGMFGKPKHLTFNSDTKYICGIKELDEKYDKGELDYKVSNIIALEKRPNGIELSLMYGFGKTRFALLEQDINSWSIEKKEKLVEEKSKSVMGRAVIGGLLLGPLGAVVGAISGVGTKRIESALEGVENIIHLSVNNNETQILLSFKDKKAKSVSSFLKSNIPDKEKEFIKLSSTDSNDKLTQLIDMFQKGLITEEEFTNQKINIQ